MIIKKYGKDLSLTTAGGLTEKSQTAVIYDFTSISEFINYITTSTSRVSNPHSSMKSSKRTLFTGTKSLEEALELMEKGWEEGANKIEKGLKEVLKTDSAIVSTRQRSVYDVIGGNASVPRYLQGVPTNMIRQVRQPVKEKIVDVNIDVCFNAGTTTEQMIESCIKQLQKVVNLENSGVRTNVYVCRISADYGVAEMVRICVKRSTERLNVLKIAFPCAHPSMLRRLLFAFDERCPELPNNDWCLGYGYAIKTEGIIHGETNIEAFLKNATKLSKEDIA